MSKEFKKLLSPPYRTLGLRYGSLEAQTLAILPNLGRVWKLGSVYKDEYHHERNCELCSMMNLYHGALTKSIGHRLLSAEEVEGIFGLSKA